MENQDLQMPENQASAQSENSLDIEFTQAPETTEAVTPAVDSQPAIVKPLISLEDEAAIRAAVQSDRMPLADETGKASAVLEQAKEDVIVNEVVKEKSEPEIVSTETHENDHDSDEDEIEDDYSGLNKLQLVELLEETVLEKDIALIKNKVAAIKVFFLKLNKEDIENEMEQFLSVGGDKESYQHIDDPLEVRFKAAFNIYKDNKSHHNELLEKQKVENLKHKTSILEDLKQLIASEETLKKTYDEFKALQDKWKDIGQVPAGEVSNLWNSYHFLVEKFFDKVKINRELRDLDLKKNLEAKIELCEKTEELLLESSVLKSFKLLQKYHEDWKEIGPVPQDKKDEVWERFKIATDKINAIRREHYASQQEEQMGHYHAKVALCEKAEELNNEVVDGINAWQNKSNEMGELFRLWKSIGQAPKKFNDEVWTRFKAAMDVFFENKKEYFGKLKDQQIENYNLKLALCAQAESLKESTEWRKSTEQIKKLQDDWKQIGPVPRRYSDKIWKRFRSACDDFFKHKSAHFDGMRGREDENLQKKEELIKQIEAFEVTRDRNTNLNSLKAFQRSWMEIGHVPMKVKDQLQVKYRKAIDDLFEKMKITEKEFNAGEYRSHFEHSRRDSESGNDQMRRERGSLAQKIQQLREEIALWENNIGFFANSKQADIMKAEYEKKISNAKNELKLLEIKQKALRD